jgi:hypothetical protein
MAERSLLQGRLSIGIPSKGFDSYHCPVVQRQILVSTLLTRRIEMTMVDQDAVESPKLIISGLNSLDEVELRDVLGEGVEFDEPEVPEGTLAEPGTITAIVIIGKLTIAALAVYLSKGRRRAALKKNTRIIYPDGRIEEQTLEIEATSEEGVKAQVFAWLSKLISQAPQI